MMALDVGLRDILQNMQSDITLTVQLSYLLPFLRQIRLVTESECQQLSSDGRESESEKNAKLIRIIIGKGENAFDLFVEALLEEQEHLGHNSLAKRLLHEQSRLKAAETKPRPPEPLPRNKKPATSGAPSVPPKTYKPQQVSHCICYNYNYISRVHNIKRRECRTSNTAVKHTA